MGIGKVLGLAALGVGAVAAAPFTGGGSLLGAATIGASLAGAGAVATGAGLAGAAAGAYLTEQEKEENRKKEVELTKQRLEAEKAEKVVKEHEHHTKIILALTALGVAMANADGKITEDELTDLNEFVGGLASQGYPEHVVKQIEKLIENPPTFNEAIKYLEKVDAIEYPEIRNILVIIMESDGVNHDAEKGFLYAFDQKVKELTA